MLRNLAIYAPFAGVERVLMALGKAGADRQEMHERLRMHAMSAWEMVQAGQPNPLEELVAQDSVLLCYLAEGDLRRLMDASQHLGDAAQRARALAEVVRKAVFSKQ
jgi:adenylosuccinate lyase